MGSGMAAPGANTDMSSTPAASASKPRRNTTKSARRRHRKATKQSAHDDILNGHGAQKQSQTATGDTDSALAKTHMDNNKAAPGASLGGEQVCQDDLGISKAAQSSEDSKPDNDNAALDHLEHQHNGLLSHEHERSSGAEEGSSITIETTESTDAHVPTTKTDDSAPISNNHEAAFPCSSRISSPAAKATEVPPQPKHSERPAPLWQHEPIEQPLDDLFVMIRQQREKLLEGPRISVHIGKLVVDDIPKRAAMAASPVLNWYFTKNPQRITYRIISINLITTDAVQYLLKTWMHETCVTFQAFAVPLQPTMTEDFAILRASSALGMKKYTHGILQSYVRYFKSHLPTYEEIVALEQDARSNPLWKIMVRGLCHWRYQKNIPDPDDFAAFLEEHEKVKIDMEKQDKFLNERGKKNWSRHYRERGQQRGGKQGEGQASMAEKEGEADS